MTICRVCTGSGSFFAVQPHNMTKKKVYKWFPCPSCNGLGTIDVDSPAKIVMHPFPKGISNRLKRNLQKLREGSGEGPQAVLKTAPPQG